MVASIAQIDSVLNFLVHALLICYYCSKVLELCHIFKGFIGHY